MEEIKLKICSICGKKKNITSFSTQGKTKNGEQRCRKNYCNGCKEKESRKTNPEKEKRKSLKKYGITLEDYELMLVKQNNRCAICNIHKDQLKISLCVDHCHSSLKVRGLLCSNCNTGIGFLNDNPCNLRLAADYIERNK